TGLAGYAVGFDLGQPLDLASPVLLMIGLYLVSSGSFAINQAQEWRTDRKMPRTSGRPVAAGRIGVGHAYFIGFLLTAMGAGILWLVQPLAAILSLITVVLYNGFYTLFWKRHWVFGAVPGAIPGAMPVVIGYAAAGGKIFSADCFY